jgi:hypothetical protein
MKIFKRWIVINRLKRLIEELEDCEKPLNEIYIKAIEDGNFVAMLLALREIEKNILSIYNAEKHLKYIREKL